MSNFHKREVLRELVSALRDYERDTGEKVTSVKAERVSDGAQWSIKIEIET